MKDEDIDYRRGDMNIPEWCEQRISGCYVGLRCTRDGPECGHDRRFSSKRLAKILGKSEAEAVEHRQKWADEGKKLRRR